MQSITTIYINSKDLSTGSPTRFVYQLINGINECDGFYIKNIIIPFSSYVSIYPPYDTTSVNFQLVDIEGVHVVTLIPGNYTAFQIATDLQNALNTASGTTFYQVLYNANTYSYTITRTDSTDFDINWQNSTTSQLPGQSIYYTFGFSNNLFGASVYNSTQVATASGTSTSYLIRSRALAIDGCYSYFQRQIDNVICEVPLNASPGGLILYEDENPAWIALRNININQIDLELMDQYGNDILLNGLNWTATICIRNKSV